MNMITLHSLLVGFLLIPFSQSEEIWMLNVKQSQKGSSENRVPGKLLWSLPTSSGVSCAALCLQKTRCLLYGYQNHICYGYLGSEARSPTVGTSAIFQGHFRRYPMKKRLYFKKKGVKERVIKDHKRKNVNEQAVKYHKRKGMNEQAVKDHKRKGMNEQAVKDHKRKAMDGGYRHLTSGSTHLLVKRHNYWRRRDEALEVCKTEGATLVKLDSQKKILLFKNEFRDRQEDEQMFWIGLDDRYDNNTWYWTDGTRLGRYSNWDLGEPHHTYNDKKENCAGIRLRSFFSGKWFDLPCKDSTKFVCERV